MRHFSVLQQPKTAIKIFVPFQDGLFFLKKCGDLKVYVFSLACPQKGWISGRFWSPMTWNTGLQMGLSNRPNA